MSAHYNLDSHLSSSRECGAMPWLCKRHIKKKVLNLFYECHDVFNMPGMREKVEWLNATYPVVMGEK